MPPHTLPRSASALFSHVMADNAPLYRAILDVFAASKRQFRLHLRPDDVLAEAMMLGLTVVITLLTVAQIWIVLRGAA